MPNYSTRRAIRSKQPRAGRSHRKQMAWLKRNRAALEAYNEHIEKDGVFSQRLRSF